MQADERRVPRLAFRLRSQVMNLAITGLGIRAFDGRRHIALKVNIEECNRLVQNQSTADIRCRACHRRSRVGT